MAFDAGAARHGNFSGCHATALDLYMADFGGLHLPAIERKNYRKISYFLGAMINAEGKRFVDEGSDFRNYTHAQFGRTILGQPGQFAWQIFDSKVFDLLHDEYRFHDAHFIEADTLDGLIEKLDGVDRETARLTLAEFNAAVSDDRELDPSRLDGRCTTGLDFPKSNWARMTDLGPFRACPVTSGITFTYGGLQTGDRGEVSRDDGSAIDGLFACGELVGGVFHAGYPGGPGLTSGAVFGRRAGYGAGAPACH